jgi:hypothetical protein
MVKPSERFIEGVKRHSSHACLRLSSRSASNAERRCSGKEVKPYGPHNILEQSHCISETECNNIRTRSSPLVWRKARPIGRLVQLGYRCRVVGTGTLFYSLTRIMILEAGKRFNFQSV